MNDLIPRQLLGSFQRKLETFPVVGLVGPRQSGKTTFVREQLITDAAQVTYLDLENPRHAARLQNAFYYLEAQADHTVIIDEVQHRPDLFTLIRPLVDADRRPGRFILLGSASPSLVRGASESLAGRISYSELGPFALSELADEAHRSRHWLLGGYPDSLLAADADIAFEWRVSYLETYITRDLPQLAGIARPDAVRRLLRMLAAQQGELLNQSALARALGVTQPSVRHWIELLEQSFLVRSLPSFHVNVKKRLVKAPKIYVRDSGLLHALARQETAEQLRDHVLCGASWEGYVIEQIAAVVSSHCELHFYRTQAGAEMDLVLIGRQGRMACVEIKLSSSPALSRGFHSARQDLGPERTLIVAPVSEGWCLAPGIEVMSLPDALIALRAW